MLSGHHRVLDTIINRRGHHQRISASVSVHAPPSSPSHAVRDAAKQKLLQLIGDTGRGFRATVHSRGAIEEAQVRKET